MGQDWEPLDTAAAIEKKRKQEQTMSGNAGAFAVPLGPVMVRGGVPVPKVKKKKS